MVCVYLCVDLIVLVFFNQLWPGLTLITLTLQIKDCPIMQLSESESESGIELNLTRSMRFGTAIADVTNDFMDSCLPLDRKRAKGEVLRSTQNEHITTLPVHALYCTSLVIGLFRTGCPLYPKRVRDQVMVRDPLESMVSDAELAHVFAHKNNVQYMKPWKILCVVT